MHLHEMKYLYILLVIIYYQNTMTIFDSELHSSTNNWKIVNDNVMGGLSKSKVLIKESSNPVFSGHVSLENNGGFAMCQYHFDKLEMNNFSKFIIKVKGDGKNYQFRVKENALDSHSYISSFKTTGEWQKIEIPFNEMFPSFRGRRLNMPNYEGNKIEMVAFLIGNKKEENFQLEIESIKAI